MLYNRQFLCKQSEEEFLASYDELVRNRDAALLRVKIARKPTLAFVLACLRRGIALHFDPKFTRRRPYIPCVLPRYQFLQVGDTCALDDRGVGLLAESGLPDVYCAPRATLEAVLALAQDIGLELVELQDLPVRRCPSRVLPFVFDKTLRPNPAYVFGNYFKTIRDGRVVYVMDQDYAPVPGAIETVFPNNLIRLQGAALYDMIDLVASGQLVQDVFTPGSKKVALKALRVEMFDRLTLTIKAGAKFGRRMFV